MHPPISEDHYLGRYLKCTKGEMAFKLLSMAPSTFNLSFPIAAVHVYQTENVRQTDRQLTFTYAYLAVTFEQMYVQSTICGHRCTIMHLSMLIPSRAY